MMLEILWERGQVINLIHFISLMISDYWTKNVLFWEKDSIFMLRGKKQRLRTPPE